jgi:hypothetical protein
VGTAAAAAAYGGQFKQQHWCTSNWKLISERHLFFTLSPRLFQRGAEAHNMQHPLLIIHLEVVTVTSC